MSDSFDRTFAVKGGVQLSAATVVLTQEGETYDVKAALDKGNGKITTADDVLIAALRGFEVLEEVTETRRRSSPPASIAKSGEKEGENR